MPRQSRPVQVIVQSRDPQLRELLGDWLRRHPRVGDVVLAADRAELPDSGAPSDPDVVVIDASEYGIAPPDAVPVDAAAPAAADTMPTAAPTVTPLTGRELDVLRLLSLGRRSLEISAVLDVSAHTVENHKRRIFAKLGVRSETQAVAEAIRLGLVHRPPARPAAPLTPRESEIINLAAAGNSVKQTARALNISVKTVESIQSHLFRKLGVSGRTGAVAAVYGRDESSDRSAS